MKKLLCIVLAIAILTGVLTLPVSAVSQNTSDKYAEQFEQYLTNIGHTPYYKGEKLYFYYELYEYYCEKLKENGFKNVNEVFYMGVNELDEIYIIGKEKNN